MTTKYTINNIVTKNPNAKKLLMSIVKKRLINGVIMQYEMAGEINIKSCIFLLLEL